MKEQQTGQGWWFNADSYSKVVGFPGICAMHIAVANIIREKLKAGPVKLLSLGISSGVLFQKFFRQELEENKLQLFGIDILENMILSCKEQLPMANLKIGNLTSFDQLFPENFDIIEAGLVLHHTLRFEELSRLIKNIYAHLHPGGLLIIADIDVSCGEYVDEKLQKLEKEHGSLSVDLATGEFFNDNIRIPIFSSTDSADNKVIRELRLTTCTPLLKELENLSPELQDKLKPLVLKNIDSAYKGLEWHRALNSSQGWKALIKNSFSPCNNLTVLAPDAIKAGFPGVLDNPFVLFAQKP